MKYIELIYNASAIDCFLGFLLLNVIIFFGSVLVGNLLVKLFKDRRITPIPEKLNTTEILYCFSTVILNAVITLIGWYLWRYGIIKLHFRFDYFVIIDVFVLMLAMDCAMYFLHRVAHIPLLLKYLHAAHHFYKNPRPLTLFVLNPFENLGFGSLWLVIISLYSASWTAITIYLTLNVVFGIVGHLGVEPFSAKSQTTFVGRLFTTSYFHAVHHNDLQYNFGFYTTLWDRLFKTLAPYYYSQFGKKLY